MAKEPTNLQAALDMLQKPADVGSIKPTPIFGDTFTPELSRDPVLRKLQQFFRIGKSEINNPLNFAAGAGLITKADKLKYLQDLFDKLRKAEKLEFDPGSAEDLAEAAKIRQSIPYASSDEITKEILDLQGAKKLDVDLLEKLRKEFNL